MLASTTQGNGKEAPLRAGVRNVGDVTVLDLSGKITVGQGEVALRRLLRELQRNGRRNILINLEQVTYLDSAGLAELVASYTRARESGGRLKLLSPCRKLRPIPAPPRRP